MEIKKKLLSTGNEVVNSSLNKIPKPTTQLNLKNIKNLSSIKEKREVISKEEKVKPPHIYQNESTTINNYSYRTNKFLQTIENHNESGKTTYYNLSKILYRDGIILKDAANPNPGYGLWAIKLTDDPKPLKTINMEQSNIINKYNNNIYSNELLNKINEKSLTESENVDMSSLHNASDYEDDVDKIVIRKLTKRNKKLEEKYQKIIIKYYDQENRYLNLGKIKNEYEKLVDESVKEKNEILKKCEKLDNNSQALVNALANGRKEIERLILLVKDEQEKMKKSVEEYNKRLLEEEEKRKKIINKIKQTESQISILQEKLEEEENNNTNNCDKSENVTGGANTAENFGSATKNEEKLDKTKLILDEQMKNMFKVKKETRKEKDLKINWKIQYIKQLQEELERLKIEDEEKLKEKRELFDLINEKNMRNKIYKNNVQIINKEIEKQERGSMWNNKEFKIKNHIIYSLKKYSNSK